jgi:hypothetical protein
MTSAQHRELAEDILADVDSGRHNDYVRVQVARAQAHAQLAGVAFAMEQAAARAANPPWWRQLLDRIRGAGA